MRQPSFVLTLAVFLISVPAASAVLAVGPSPASVCGDAPLDAGCVSWTRLASGQDLCGLSGWLVIDTREAWDEFLASAGPCLPEGAHDVDFVHQWVSFIGVWHPDCCDHSTTVLAVEWDDEGYLITYVHVNGNGIHDTTSAPYELLAIDRVPGAPVSVRYDDIVVWPPRVEW